VSSSEKELDLNPSSFMGLPDATSPLAKETLAKNLGRGTPVVWEKALDSLRREVDPQLFTTWLRPLHCESCETSADKCLVTASAPNKFTAEHVRAAYGKQLRSALAKVAGAATIELKIIPKLQKPVAKDNRSAEKVTKSVAKKSGRAAARRTKEKTNLNPKYNFSNFVVGGCNQFAHAASMRVTEQLGANYNPLFLYGGVGLGKTHLANAIGNAAYRRGKKVLLVSSEIFVNELITSLRNNSMQAFKERFRSLDLLIVDDIQFIIGKERTQEEFFHTFNALYQNRKQIVITSDKVPQELVGLEERLATRFASGLSADLQAPDFETRVAILGRKAEADGIRLSNDVARFLAEKIDSNVRELEGALNRLHALSSIEEQPISLELADTALNSVVGIRTREITIELIQKTVAENFNLQLKDLFGKRRTQHIALPRQIAMYLCRKLTSSSYPEIGSHFGGRDHSTVIHAFRVIEEKLERIPSLRKDVEKIERRLRS